MDSKSLSYRGKIRIILYILTAVIILGIFGVIQTVKLNAYKNELNATRQAALISLDEYLSNISVNLEKTVYAGTSPMISELATELFRETSNAKNSLSLLPTTESTVSSTYKFLSQVGEFIMSLERKAAKGEKITSEERERLKELYDYCVSLNEKTAQMCYEMQHGSFSFEKSDSLLAQGGAEKVYIGDGFDDAEQSLSDFPTLIYDGPFSSHIENAKPKFLDGKGTVTKERASAVAKKVCDSDVFFAYEEDGTIPCYVFQSEDCTVGITKVGGKPLYMLNSQYAGEIKTGYNEAINLAKAYLKKIGYGDLKESYYFTDDGICTVNFTAIQDGVILYADLIKISVNLENGQITAFDATGYISNHEERTFSKIKITESEIKDIISTDLEIVGIQKCMIPTEWKTENFCYEVHCKTDGNREILVYVNCETGAENDILILLYSDGGVLTK